MKNTLLIERPKSNYQKRSLQRKENGQKSLKPNNHHSNKIFTSESESDLDNFFDKFHDTFVVLEKSSKTKSIKNKIKTLLQVDLDDKKIFLQHPNSKLNKKDAKEKYIPNQQTKIVKSTKIKSTLQKNNKTCQSERNLTNLHNQIEVKKISEKKTQAYSKRKSSIKNSKKGTTKKNTCTTGSTATTTLKNSGINLKEDIHIASYLRIKIKPSY